jgi:hypothetical protein
MNKGIPLVKIADRVEVSVDLKSETSQRASCSVQAIATSQNSQCYPAWGWDLN